MEPNNHEPVKKYPGTIIAGVVLAIVIALYFVEICLQELRKQVATFI